MMDPKFDEIALKDWFNKQKRSLPWRNNPSPYAVWVSEVMLQQTQVAVVIPYFQRWMQLFPTIEALATAPLDEVIKAWEGLGYYSRARNLHAGASVVLSHYDGKLPIEASELAKVKGIGPYTVGAIRSFAFHQKAAAVDGNVMRVLARYYNIEEDICQPKTLKKIWYLAEEILPENESWVLTEGLIELGATVCTKKPKCLHCPLKKTCQGYIQGTTDELPYKSIKMKTEKLYRAVAVVRNSAGKILVKHVQTGKVMSGLHEFPYFESPSDGIDSEELVNQIKEQLGLKVLWKGGLPKIQHSFTRFQVSLFPHNFHCRDECEVSDFQWMSAEDMKKIAFSSGHRRLYEMIKNKCIF
ncbi:MAG: A/G-specific adenine glycosylase [Parachlamydiaceae bacterium]|nr:A/G-specific adenine glycosylase [Parachlamydiaceae bacterium]